MTPIVLDSWAVLAYLGEEPLGDLVERLLEDCRDAGRPMLMCVINVAEVRYKLLRRGGPRAAEAGRNIIRGLGIEVVPVDEPVAQEAADLKADTPVAFADCFAAALGRLRDAEVATADPEFRELGDRVKVLWLGAED